MKLRHLYLVLLSILAAGCTTPYIVATQAVQRGDELSNAGQFQQAIDSYKQFTDISSQLGVERDLTMESVVFRKMSVSAAALGQYPAAISYTNKALQLDSVSKDVIALTEDHRQLGLIYGYQGNLRVALRHLMRAHDLLDDKATSTKETLRSAAAENDLSLARLQLTLGNYAAAIAYAQSALRLGLPISSAWPIVAESQLVLGNIYRETGEWNQSEVFLKASRDLARRNGLMVSPQELALGDLEAVRGNLQAALKLKISALDEAKKSGIVPQIMQAHIRIGDTYRQLGDETNSKYHYQQALTIGNSINLKTSSLDLRNGKFQEALQKAEEEGAGLSAGIASLRMGEAFLDRGITDSARLMIQRAKNLFSEIGSPDGAARSLLAESRLEIKQANWEGARQAAVTALATTRQPDIQWQAEMLNGMGWEALGKYDSARSAYTRSIHSIERMRSNLTLEDFKSSFANSRIEVYGRLLQLLLNQSSALGLHREEAVRMAFELNEQARSRAFLDLLGNRKISAKQDADTSLLRQEHLLKLKLSRLSHHLRHQSNRSVSYEQLASEWEKAHSEHQQLIQKIKLASPAYEELLPSLPPAIQEISASLPPSTAIVEYWVGPDALNIWVIKKSGTEAFTVPVRQVELTREITRCRKVIAQQIDEVTDESIRKLSQWLIDPIAEKIEHTQELIFIPHRNLHFIPFQALRIRNKYLIESYAVGYAPSAAVFTNLQQAPPVNGSGMLAMALGNSELDGFNALPGSARELKSISRFYPAGRIKSEKEFTETELRRSIGSASQIHLATHGILDAAFPLNSYLLMHAEGADDGRLTVNEILDLRLKARLVTLSACETGLGTINEGDELIGLSRSFLYAGSSGIIVSLWKVDDATTAWLMTRFYQHLNAGLPVVTALALAQREMISMESMSDKELVKGIQDSALLKNVKDLGSESIRHPYYWAPFLYIGADGRK